MWLSRAVWSDGHTSLTFRSRSLTPGVVFACAMVCVVQRNLFGYGTRAQTLVLRCRRHVHYLFRNTDQFPEIPPWKHWRVDVAEDTHTVQADVPLS